MKYTKESIRELLIEAIHSKNKAINHLNTNLNNEELLNTLVEIATDDYSNDARMEASFWISKFDKDLLKNIEQKLLIIQQEELDSIACHIFIALGKIKSKKGLEYLIEKRIKPDKYWEAEALKYYFDK